MTKARTNADNVAGDISGVTAGTGLTGGGTSGTVTLTNDMATTIAAKGDLLVGTADNAYTNLSVASTNGYVLQANSATTSGLSWAEGLPSQTSNSGKYLTTNGTTASWGTVPGVNFTFRASIANGTDSVNTIEYNGSNLYVAAGGGGTASVLATSPDGITWTTRTSGFGTQAINKVAFGNGLWVAVGDNGVITTSSDGTTWTARTSNMGTNSLKDVRYANSIWVVVGAGGGTTNTGGIAYSTDGITWTRKSQSLTIGATYNGVIWNGTNWIVAANVATNNYLYASAPSGTWTVGTDGSGADLISIFWDGTRHIVGLNTGIVRFSTSTTLGTTTVLTGGGMQNTSKCNYYYNGSAYTLGQSFVTTMSTTPATGNVASKTNPYLQPGIRINSSGGVSTDGSTISVFAAGTIIGGNNGEIWTSF